MDSLLLLALVGAALMGYLGFVLGERRRRAAQGGARPRPARSVGEALEAARVGSGRALLIFVGESPGSDALRAALETQPMWDLLRRPGLSHVILTAESEGEDLLAHLYAKYQGEALPGLPAGILCEGGGEVRASGLLRDSGLEQLEGWLALSPLAPS